MAAYTQPGTHSQSCCLGRACRLRCFCTGWVHMDLSLLWSIKWPNGLKQCLATNNSWKNEGTRALGLTTTTGWNFNNYWSPQCMYEFHTLSLLVADRVLSQDVLRATWRRQRTEKKSETQTANTYTLSLHVKAKIKTTDLESCVFLMS